MTKIVSPEEFNEAFLAVAKRRKSEIEGAWEDSPAYTRAFVNDRAGVLAQVAKKLELEYYPGCWGIDAVMYERYETNLGEGWPEQLSVVVEHENQIAGAHQEVNKLSTYNSPLKVLITYPWVKTAPTYLTKYADILRRADVFNDFTTHRRHVVIFGFGPEDDVTWESYVYRSGKFVSLGDKP